MEGGVFLIRPLKESGKARNVSVNIRISEEEKEMIDTLADARGLDKTTLLVTLVKEDMERRKDLLEAFRKMQALRK